MCTVRKQSSEVFSQWTKALEKQSDLAASPPVPYLPVWWAVSGSERWPSAAACPLLCGWPWLGAEPAGWTAPSFQPSWGCRGQAPPESRSALYLFLLVMTSASGPGSPWYPAPAGPPSLAHGQQHFAVRMPAGWGGEKTSKRQKGRRKRRLL